MADSAIPLRELPELPEDLRVLAEQAMSNARRELELTGRLNPAVIVRAADGATAPLRLDDGLAELFFGNGARRHAFFRALRRTVELSKATAVIMVTDVWTGKTTPEFHALPYAEQKRTLDKGPSLAALEERGLVTRCEAITVAVQTAGLYAVIEQLYERDTRHRQITWSTRQFRCGPQADLHGQMKMFGQEEKTTQ